MVLSGDTLGSQVEFSSLTTLGTMVELVIDDIRLNANTIESINAETLHLKSDTPITILDSSSQQGSQRITGLGEPVNPTDAVTKQYADGGVSAAIELDISGIGKIIIDSSGTISTTGDLCGNDLSIKSLEINGKLFPDPNTANDGQILVDKTKKFNYEKGEWSRAESHLKA